MSEIDPGTATCKASTLTISTVSLDSKGVFACCWETTGNANGLQIDFHSGITGSAWETIWKIRDIKPKLLCQVCTALPIVQSLKPKVLLNNCSTVRYFSD